MTEANYKERRAYRLARLAELSKLVTSPGSAKPDGPRMSQVPSGAGKGAIRLPSGTTHVRYSELAHLIASALWPGVGPDDDGMTYALARVNLDDEVRRAAVSGELPVKNPLTLGPHTLPRGPTLQQALVALEDFRSFVGDRSLTVEIDNGAAPAPASLPSDPNARRVELLAKFRELGGKRPCEGAKKGTRGALAALQRATGIDDKNLGQMLDKAIDERRRAEAYAQLTRNR